MEREIRYTVLKHVDCKRFLSPADQHALNRIESIITASREAEGRGELGGLVIESDWPEYEPAYKMIEDRVDVAPSRQSELKRKARLYDMIRSLMGYVENDSDEIVTLFQDDATRNYFIRLGRNLSNEVFGHSIENVIAKAYEMYAEKPDETN